MLLKITLLFSCMAIVYSLQCPTEGWFDVTGIGCFHFSSEAEEVTWFEAEQYCKNLESGAWLAEIPNVVTQAFLQGYMGLDIIPTQDWWIGANDLWKVKNDFMQKKTVRKKSF